MKKKLLFISLLLWLSSMFLQACKEEDAMPDIAQKEENEEFSGGKLTTFDKSENAFGNQATGLSSEESDFFVIGNSFFRNNWTTAPASATARDGLGPLMNAASCGSCHNLDGRAKPPSSVDDAALGLLFRLSSQGIAENGGPKPEPNYGLQLNTKAVPNAEPEGIVKVSYTEIMGKYDDGTSYSLRKPNYEFSNWAYGQPTAGWLYSPRIGMQVAGLGLLEALADNSILVNADENDSNSDGISGKPNYVWDAVSKSKKLGRFGWKSNQPNLFQQTAGAFLGDIGITSSLFSEENLIGKSYQLYKDFPKGGHPEISDENLKNVTFYLQTLAVPARRNWEDNTVLRGKKLFEQANCGGCHTPKFQTANTHDIENFEKPNYSSLFRLIITRYG
ncbi:MAG: di-heme oxidoredictase family protein [Emticicia sp.]|nr:di-heme oxidoredictase family protein [Emticicia sp.]